MDLFLKACALRNMDLLCFVVSVPGRGGFSLFQTIWNLWGNNCCVVWFTSAWNKSDFPPLHLAAYSWKVLLKFLQLSKHLILLRAKLSSNSKPHN